MGEEEAWDASQELIDVADEHGALRGIIDAVKSNRLYDDFSAVWSYERASAGGDLAEVDQNDFVGDPDSLRSSVATMPSRHDGRRTVSKGAWDRPRALIVTFREPR